MQIDDLSDFTQEAIARRLLARFVVVLDIYIFYFVDRWGFHNLSLLSVYSGGAHKPTEYRFAPEAENDVITIESIIGQSHT
jgi:hypothetical protein